MRTTLFALALALATAATAVPLSKRDIALQAAPTTLPPSQDPFYQAPTGFQRASPGQVFKARPVWTAFDSEASAVYQVLYKTTLATGDDGVTAATLFAPLQPASPPRIMVLAAPIDSACRDCEVTYGIQNGGGSNATDFILSTVAIDILAGLYKGWYVSVPDHEGPKAAYIAGVQEAFGVIDGLRAMLNFPNILPKTDGYKAVIHGYSGGAHASAWANQFLPTYGKGLNVVAAAYGGTPVDSFSTLDLLNGSPGAYLAWGALVGLANAYPELNTFFERELFPNGTAALQAARSLCNTELAPVLYEKSFYSFFRYGRDTLNMSTAAKYTALGLLGNPVSSSISPAAQTDGVVRIPTFMYHSITDNIVSYKPVPAYVQSQCERGAKILFESAPGFNHTVASVVWTGDAYNYLESAFDGTLKLDQCNQTLGVSAQPGTPAYISAIGPTAWSLIQGQM